LPNHCSTPDERIAPVAVVAHYVTLSHQMQGTASVTGPLDLRGVTATRPASEQMPRGAPALLTIWVVP